MLKDIPKIISPDLMKILMEMGHGDEITIGDGNFPSSSNAKRLIRYDACTIKPLLGAILRFFPLDYRIAPVMLMEIPSDSDYKGKIQEEYLELIEGYHGGIPEIKILKRENFYNRASESYAIVATGETERFANIILRKGIIT